MNPAELEEAQRQIVATVREFVQKDVVPQAAEHDENDTYPTELVEQMAEMGLFGITIPEAYGGLGLDYTTYAMVFEELCKGWMSISAPIGTHSILSAAVNNYGTEAQKQEWLPKLASGEKRGGLALTEPGGGSDVASLQTTAVKDGEEYVVNGNKLFITNGRSGDVYLLLAKTDTSMDPQHRGISAFIAEKGPGFTAGRDLNKLGYRGVDTSELIFQDYRVSADQLVGGEEGKGFYHVMDALETGRINIAARAVGVATGAFELAIKYAQERETFGAKISTRQTIQNMLADMATKIHAARLMTYDAAKKKDSGVRIDLEAGMAKLYASEICAEVTMDAMRIHGGLGYIKDLPLERFYRDAPLMIIGEGTSEIQRLVIAKNLLKQYAI
ncbi:MAG: acyl-CoA dehydrogenase [Chloroflexi bacterium]|jgi:alkylation response protein AidB-like acyl-CoA dehydrogenase|nr:acyl-CoA dehydrogenase [Chloroflexota bacterium]MBT4514147.1 acyl-CoA dehydrogenase [Chloroflexota bacterium]